MRNQIASVVLLILLPVLSVVGQEPAPKEALEMKCFRLKRALPDRAFKVLEVLRSKGGDILVDENSGTVVIQDKPENLAKMKKALEVLEKKKQIAVFHVKRSNGKDIEILLKDWLEKMKVGRVKLLEGDNLLVVEAFPGRIEDVKTLVTSLGGKLAKSKVPNEEGLPDIERIRVEVKVVGQDKEGKDKTATYSLLVADGTQAALHQGRSVPYTTDTTAMTEQGHVKATDVNFVDVGVIIRATVYADYDGTVRVSAKVELSKLVSKTGDGTPVIEKTELQSTSIHKGSEFVKVASGNLPVSNQPLDIYLRAVTVGSGEKQD